MSHAFRTHRAGKAGIILVSLIASASGSPFALGQAQYFESFDDNGEVGNGATGPVNLVAKGWIFREQSSGESAQAPWHDGYTGYIWPDPHQGAGYLAAHPTLDAGHGTISQWAILPAVPNQAPGDAITLWVQDVSPFMPTWLEIRYSPSGGAGTGSDMDDVGDFMQVIASLDEIPNQGWSKVTGSVPGAGRIAIRYGGDWSYFDGPMYTGFDTLSVGPEPEPPCNLPPLPQPGQTVTWSAAEGPYQICQSVLIPAGSKVIIEPGAIVTIDPNETLFVEGELIAHGTAQKPVIVHGGWNSIKSDTGLISFSRATVDCWVTTGSGTILAADSTFTGKGVLRGGERLVIDATDRYKYIQVDRCTFSGGDVLNGIEVSDGTVVVRDSTFTGCGIGILRGYLWIDNVTVDGAQVGITREWPGQPAFYDNVTVKNNTAGPGFRLDGGNYVLGDDNTIANNKFPVTLTAGLLAGTALPQSGNLNNYIDAPVTDLTPRGRLTWTNTGLPYVVQGWGEVAGELRLEPGVTVNFKPGAGWAFVGEARLLPEGLPTRRITLQRHLNQAWTSIVFKSNTTRPQFENCDISGSQFGLIADDSPLAYLQNTLVQGHGTGLKGANGGFFHVMKSRFFNNGTGIFNSANANGQTNPNWFEGNGLAADGPIDARNNYWGHSTGPDSPQNPSGQGDTATAGVSVLPFLTSPPDIQDAPPVVRAHESGYFRHSGDKAIIRWDAQDDGRIESFKIQYSEFGFTYKDIATLPADARSFEFTVPVRQPSNLLEPAVLRIVATDDAGQIGFDDTEFQIPYHGDWTPPTVTIPIDTGRVYIPGQNFDICKQGGGSIDYAYLLLDGDGESIPLGGTNTDCLSIGANVPYLSTDLARIGIIYYYGAGQRYQWYVSDYFTIRPDARVDNAAPAITMTSPAPGETFEGGAILPITWAASDPEGLRSFTIQQSTDGGYNWTTVAKDLPPDATSYAWRLPSSGGIDDARVRVIAHDLHFQNTSDGTDTSFTILPGQGGCKADLDGSGSLDLFDFLAFTNLFNDDNMLADFDASGSLDLFDFLAFTNSFNQGC